MSNILFGDHQYSMTGYVIGSNGSALAKYSSSLTPNVIYAPALSRHQQQEDLLAWISNLDLHQAPTQLNPLADEPVAIGGGGPVPDNPVRPTPTLISITQPAELAPEGGAATVPEPSTGALLIITLLLFAFWKRVVARHAQ